MEHADLIAVLGSVITIMTLAGTVIVLVHKLQGLATDCARLQLRNRALQHIRELGETAERPTLTAVQGLARHWAPDPEAPTEEPVVKPEEGISYKGSFR